MSRFNKAQSAVRQRQHRRLASIGATVNFPQILGIRTANLAIRLTQEQSFSAAGHRRERIRKIFLNSDIQYRRFYFEGAPNREETSDQMNQRYLSGAMKTGCRAIRNCLKAAGANVQDVDFLAVSTCTGYVCPDVASRLIAHMGLRWNVQRASLNGLGCADVLPMLQQAADFVRANPGRLALALAWIVHPGGRKVIDNVQKHFSMTDTQLRFARDVLLYGNMSSPTVMFVLDEVVRKGEPRPQDWGVMIALGPGMAAEAALLRW